MNHNTQETNHQFPAKRLIVKSGTKAWIVVLFISIPLLLIIIYLITIYSLFWKDDAHDRSGNLFIKQYVLFETKQKIYILQTSP